VSNPEPVTVTNCAGAAEGALKVVICGDVVLNVAVADLGAFIVTEQVPVPVQAPLQPAKVELDAGVAVKVTEVPLVKVAEQVVGQLIPDGLLATVPVPVPALVTARVKACVLNVAVTDLAAFIVTVQVPVPEHPPPLQPANTEPLAALAVRVTEVPLLNDAEQVLPQLIPAGLLVTVPLPAPDLFTVRVKRSAVLTALRISSMWTFLITL